MLFRSVEYSGFLFALFFLSEYTNMLFLSSVFTLLFLGAGHLPVLTWLWPVGSFGGNLCFSLIFIIKSLLILFTFIWVRATLPRYRYDQLMTLGWKVFLPLTFGYLVFLMIYLYLIGLFPTQLF